MEAMYFVSYALIATVAGGVIAQAQYARRKAEGTPINLSLLKVIGGLALVLWAAAGVTEALYKAAA